MRTGTHTQPPAGAGTTSVRLRALVVSDIHAVPDSKPTRRSWADMSDQHNPISRLPDFLKKRGITADVILCPGDLGDRAHQAASTWAWDRVQELAASIGASHVIATAGNHDTDSRHLGGSLDPRNHLKSLSPEYPVRSTSADYWAYSMTMVANSGWRVVTLDSCFHHDADESEHDHGRIESYAVERLEDQLTATDAEAEVNVLLCHHHPMPHTELDPKDRSSMLGGDRLLDLLDRDRHGRWLVVHGHKHFPWLRYAPGSSISPVVFSAGSASVVLYDALHTQVRNQIHLIEFDTALSSAVNLHLAGRFKSWMWSAGSGWGPAPLGSGLPGHGGFGFRVDLKDLAQQIADEHRRLGRQALRAAELESMEPRLPYLAPIDLSALKDILDRDKGIALRLYSDGTISDTQTS